MYPHFNGKFLNYFHDIEKIVNTVYIIHDNAKLNCSRKII